MNEAAKALNLASYELLMRPEQAMAIRRIRLEAIRVVESGAPLEPTGTTG